MSSNSFGKVFTVTTFGESHGEMIGVVIDGCPSGLKIDFEFVQQELNRRKPGVQVASTTRKENDKVNFVSGIQDGITTGAPIAAIVLNEDYKPEDYKNVQQAYRPSHADFTYQSKYGIRSTSGGGRSSARETVCRVIAGAVAKILLKNVGIDICAFVKQIGSTELRSDYKMLNLDLIEASEVKCPDPVAANVMVKLIEQAKQEGDTLGGVVTCVIQGCPVGIGEPVYDKLQADLAKAMMSINAVKGFEYGSGFTAASMKGTEHNDEFYIDNGSVKTKSNHSGGIQGGISNGMEIYFNVAFKPVSTILKKQKTVDMNGSEIELTATGRHDVCVVPRAVPIVEAMAAIVLADHYLRNLIQKAV
mgnify:CR=1 FL=1